MGQYQIVSTLVRFGKYQKLGVPPDFTDSEIILHPLPNAIQNEFVEGEEVKGRFGRIHESGRKDKNGRDIRVQYFIPDGYNN